MGWKYTHEGGRAARWRRVPPVVGVLCILVTAPLGYAALATLGKGAGLCVAGAAAGGLVTTWFLYLLLGAECSSRSQVEHYLWGRLGMGLVAAPVATLGLHFLWGWPWLVAAAAGPAAGIALLAVAIFVISQL